MALSAGRVLFSLCLVFSLTTFCAAQQMQEVAGKVVTKEGKPVAGAKVVVCSVAWWAQDASVLAQGMTGSDGSFRFQVPVHTHIPGRFESQVVAATASGYAVGGADVPEGGAKNLRIILHKAAPVSGTVTDKAGQPVANVKVRVAYIHVIQPNEHYHLTLPETLNLLTTTTKGNGAFWIGGIPKVASDVSVIATPSESEFARTRVQAKPWQRDVKITMLPPATIEGKVVYETGEGAGGLTVSAMTMGESRGWGKAETGADGSFRITGLAPGRYQLQVVFKEKEPEWVVTQNPQVSVSDGGFTSNVEIKLIKGEMVTGKVLDADTKKPVANAGVSAWLSQGGWQTWGKTDATGTFRLRVPPGQIDVSVSIPPKGYLHTISQQLTITAGTSPPPLTFLLQRGVRITGKVLGPNGKPVEGVKIQTTRPWEVGDTESGKGGIFTLDGAAPGQPMTVIALYPKRHWVGRASFTPQRGKAAKLTIRLRQGASAEGKVTDMRDKPISNAQVRVTMRAPHFGFTSQGQPVQTDRQGRFKLKDLIPGEQYQVSANAQGYASRSSQMFTVRRGRTIHVPPLKLKKADSFLAGIVTDPEGKPIMGVNVNVWGDGTSGSASTDAEGKFEIKNLVKGSRVQVSLWHNDYHHDWQQNIQTGRRDLRFVLMPKPKPVTPEVAVGKAAPELKIEQWVNGDGVSLKELQGKVVLIAFCSAYAPSCEKAVKTLKALHERFSEQGLVIVQIHDRSASSEELSAWAKERVITYHVGIVPKAMNDGWSSETFQKFGVQAVPTIFLLDRQGIVRYADVQDGLEEKVEALLAQ